MVVRLVRLAPLFSGCWPGRVHSICLVISGVGERVAGHANANTPPALTGRSDGNMECPSHLVMGMAGEATYSVQTPRVMLPMLTSKACQQ
uniref:Putative secreted protein n=1 Tax=Anopheles darlingi TaxID=43151 RepID=A0A2M4DRN6_ANODA